MQRQISFNAWIPSIGVMLESVTVHAGGDVGYASFDFKEEVDKTEYIYEDYEVNDKEGNAVLKIMLGDEWVVIDQKDVVLLQFTGISYPIRESGFNEAGDYKNYQPLYDGDIVEFIGGTTDVLHCGIYSNQFHEKGTLLVIRWLESGFTLSLPRHLSEDAPNIVGNVGNYDLWKFSGSLKVVGNRYENPSLLTPKQ